LAAHLYPAIWPRRRGRARRSSASRSSSKGSGALGTLHGADEADIRPDRIAGISIGAINGADCWQRTGSTRTSCGASMSQKGNIMEYATLGNTGLLVSKLCFGTMTFGDGRGLFKAISTVGQAEADELVKTSIAGGINFFDTADNYTEGESERILGQSLKNLNIARQDVVIATKVYSRVGPGRNDIGASRGHIMDGVEASLRRLQTDHY
jgi:Aldo/keto reductase family